ncbi:MAG: hypothetical protein ABR991_12480 [Terracidiphilus sp.]
MVTCYFDEAGGDDLRRTYVCGYVASIAQWERFEIDWKILLAKYDVPYFHMKECAQFKGPFAKWKSNQSDRSYFLRDAAQIIRMNTQHGFISLLSHDIFEEADRLYHFRKVFKTAYSLAGRCCIESAYEWRKNTTEGALDIEFVFEDGCSDKGSLINAMSSYLPRRNVPSFRPSRDSEPSKECPEGRIGIIPLQAADFLAYENRKALVDLNLLKSGQRKFRKSILALFKGMPFSLNLLTPDVIDRICMDGGIERRL